MLDQVVPCYPSLLPFGKVYLRVNCELKLFPHWSLVSTAPILARPRRSSSSKGAAILLPLAFLSQGLRMEQTPMMQPQLRVSTRFGQPVSSVALTVSLLACKPSTSSSLEDFFATVRSSQSPTMEHLIFLSPPNLVTGEWQGFHLIQIAYNRFPPLLTVSFWRHSTRSNFPMVKVGVREAPFCGFPGVSQYTYLRCSMN